MAGGVREGVVRVPAFRLERWRGEGERRRDGGRAKRKKLRYSVALLGAAASGAATRGEGSPHDLHSDSGGGEDGTAVEDDRVGVAAETATVV